MTTLAQYLAAGCKKYGYQITELEYRALYRAQGGRCYVCRKAKGKARRLAVDHDHLTGEVRGLVCSGSLTPTTCNRLIAYYNRDQLLRAADMLTDPPPAREVLQAVRGGFKVPSLVGGFRFEIGEVARDGQE
jgi:hypothetical protein